MSYVYIGFTILFTVYGQIVIKWQAANAGPLPEASHLDRVISGRKGRDWRSQRAALT